MTEVSEIWLYFNFCSSEDFGNAFGSVERWFNWKFTNVNATQVSVFLVSLLAVKPSNCHVCFRCPLARSFTVFDLWVRFHRTFFVKAWSFLLRSIKVPHKSNPIISHVTNEASIRCHKVLSKEGQRIFLTKSNLNNWANKHLFVNAVTSCYYDIWSRWRGYGLMGTGQK